MSKERGKEVKPKKIKLKKKDRFAEVKKAMVPTYIAPDFLSKKYGIKQVFDSGIFMLKNQISNKFYSVKCKDNMDKQGVFDVLRSYDFGYRFYYFDNKTYLLIQINSDEKQDASFDFDAIEKELFKKLAGLGVTLDALNLEDRLRFIHQYIVKDKPDSNNNIMDYVHNVIAWKADFKLDGIQEYMNGLKIGDKEYYFFYFNRFGNNTTEMLQELSKIEGVESIMVEHNGISDGALYGFFHNNFMGCDNELRKLKKLNNSLYEILIDPTMRDSRSYSMVGINVLYAVSSQDADTVKEKIQFIVDRYDASIYYFCGEMASAFVDFSPLGEWKNSELRLVKNSESCNCMLFNEGNASDVGDSELNKFFMGGM